MSTFDELMDELEDAGVQPAYLERIRKATEASPIRAERDKALEEARALKERTKSLEGRILNQTLTEVGIKAKPDALRLPDDLDVADPDKVRSWALEAGLIEAAPDTPPEEMEAHERVAAASTGAPASSAGGVLTPANVSEWSADKWMRFKKSQPEAAEALLRGEEVRNVPV